MQDYQVFIKTAQGRVLPVDVKRADTIRKIKIRIQVHHRPTCPLRPLL